MPVVRRCDGQTSAAYGPTMAKPPSAKKKASARISQNADSAEQRGVVIVAGQDGQDAGAEAEQAAAAAPSDPSDR